MYDFNKLRMYFDAGSYSRGERYFRQGRVSALRLYWLQYQVGKAAKGTRAIRCVGWANSCVTSAVCRR